jgi:Zn-dependent M28 family amino/carboxypeptidase
VFRRVISGLILSFLVIPLAPDSPVYSNNDPVISSFEQIAEDTLSAPCKNSDRLAAVKVLFQKLGAEPDRLVVEKPNGIENLVIEIPGKTQEAIIIGAHYDKSPEGCGAVDNWTGIVALAHIYRTLKDLSPQKRIVLVAFGEEEKGLRGSKAMVGKFDEAQLGQYCAMINIDSLGLGAPQVALNISSKKLMDKTAEIASKMKMPFGQGPVPGNSDSSSFISKRIPAVTIHGLADGFEKIIHSSNDKVSKINADSVYLGYRLALALAAELLDLPCDAMR